MLPFRRSLHPLLPRKPARSPSDLPPLPSHARISSTDTVTEKKSVFQGHAVRVKSVEEAALALQHVLTLKRVSKASHNILAYRLPELQTGASDCDGEAPAGKNLLELLQKLDVQDVLLVVTRWYGGSPMGPDRFRVINASPKTAKQRR
ncbi:hypothetical protein Rhopal_001149-T1 [Rhodotorula paludigena]|uniref:Impact N-terminal domain-containing protein n=1 Tax=Rhodotorula paludigena TaxID=86838 RepID=A0AAV5GE72_9BASI|nr:hypothetical protein Rhopal_001149-T1 [Rhodotorula paludigena]